MDSAQLTSLVRHFLTMGSGGIVMAWLAHKFNLSPDDLEAIVAIIAAIAALVWAHRSNTPQALARKLVDNPAIDNTQAGNMIKAGTPEKVVTVSPSTTGKKQ